MSNEQGHRGFGPHPTEQVFDHAFEEMAIQICRRPSMYVVESRYMTVCAYLMGYDQAKSGGPLMGFHQWLVVRFNGADNLGWLGIVRLLHGDTLQNTPDDKLLLDHLGKTLGEFFECRRTNGLSKIFRDYGTWLLRRSWYTGPLRQKS